MVSFWKLLNDYTVKIPMIQRDYAHGRRDTRTMQIRESFLADLKNTVNSQHQSINLDFVYGSDHSGYLVLLDGQQRLTTLFLLHWYLASRCPKVAPHAAVRLKKFTYETRTTTRNFCDALTDQLQGSSIFSKRGTLVSTWIEDASWFPRSWKRDPSIAGMLTTLDSIQQYFGESESSAYWARLTCESNPAVTFQFLNMEEFRLTDELYIKMNARGRALSDFENFKAWLQMYVERKKFVLEPNDWTDALDGRWTDLFWNFRPLDAEEIDDVYLNFFNGQTLCAFAASRQIEKGQLEDNDSRVIQTLNDNEYFGATAREALNVYTAETLSRCFAVLDAFCDPGATPKNYLPWFTQPRNYSDHVLAHATTIFLAQPAVNGTTPALGCVEFNRWLRVSGNLIRNTTIDSPITFVRAVKAINRLANRLFSLDGTNGHLYAKFATLDSSEIDFFTKAQCVEEVQKCRLICDDSNWEKFFVAAESHEYFFGQIGFLINFSTVAGVQHLTLFRQYWLLTSLLFDEHIRKHGKYLLQRALLSYGDYTVELGSNQNLCSGSASVLRDREENWRRVFRDPGRHLFLKQLCDDLLQHEPDVERTVNWVAAGLSNIIEHKALPPTGSIDDWRRTLVKSERLLCKCKYLQIRRMKETPGSDYTSTYLLAGVRMSGSHAELSTYNLWLQHLKEKVAQGKFRPFTKGEYHWVSGGAERPYASLDGWRFSECDIAIHIYNNGGLFEISMRERANELALPARICKVLQTDFGFSSSRDGIQTMVLLVPVAEIIQCLDKITAGLSTLIESELGKGEIARE